MFRNLMSSRESKFELGQREMICPTCLHVTAHKLEEVRTEMTLLGIAFSTLSRRVVFYCGRCGDTHSMDWKEFAQTYSGQTAAPVTGGAATATAQQVRAQPAKTQLKQPQPTTTPEDRLLRSYLVVLLSVMMLVIILLSFVFLAISR